MVQKSILFALLLLPLSNSAPPNIVFVLFDDVGWADFDYNVDGRSAIPTPNLGSNSIERFVSFSFGAVQR